MASNNDTDLILEKIQANWSTVLKLIDKIENTETKLGAQELCDKLHDRFAVCPASSKREYVGCFPGGLTWHSLNVIRIMKELRKIFEIDSNDQENAVSNDTIIVLGLFHDIGKLGNENEDYYFAQSNDYYRKRGNLYEIHPKLINIPVSTRSIWWLNHFNIWLNEKELHAINTLNVKGNEVVSYNPSLREPMEVFLLQTAVRGSCIKYAGYNSILDT